MYILNLSSSIWSKTTSASLTSVLHG